MKRPLEASRIESHRRNLWSPNVQEMSMQEKAQRERQTHPHLSTAISRNHNHLPFAPTDLAIGGTTSATSESEYRSSTLFRKSLKALNNLKWDLTCAIVTNGRLSFFVPTLKVIKSECDDERAVAEIGVRVLAPKLGLGLGLELVSGSGPGRRPKREPEGFQGGGLGFGCTAEESVSSSSFNG